MIHFVLHSVCIIFARIYMRMNLKIKIILDMKLMKSLPVAVALLTLCSAFTSGDKNDEKVYAFGVAASFKDSVVYFTDIQPLDSVELEKHGFLPERSQYTYQLKNHLESQMGKPDYTCMIYFNKNKNRLHKEALKVQAKYKKSKGIVLKTLGTDAFKFEKPQE